jgi:hypothetical protein
MAMALITGMAAHLCRGPQPMPAYCPRSLYWPINQSIYRVQEQYNPSATLQDYPERLRYKG